VSGLCESGIWHLGQAPLIRDQHARTAGDDVHQLGARGPELQLPLSHLLALARLRELRPQVVGLAADTCHSGLRLREP
ncbi:unnamed protein product, partial [Symbiodinium necroappetens]